MRASSNPNNPNALKLIVAAGIAGTELELDFQSDPKRECVLLTSLHPQWGGFPFNSVLKVCLNHTSL